MSIQRYTLNYGLSHGECSAEFLKDSDGEWVKAEDLPGWQPIDTAPKDETVCYGTDSPKSLEPISRTTIGSRSCRTPRCFFNHS